MRVILHAYANVYVCAYLHTFYVDQQHAYIFRPLDGISDLSFGKSTTPDSPAVMDGNPHICWPSDASINPWWSVDLGRYALILAVRIVKSPSGKHAIAS